MTIAPLLHLPFQVAGARMVNCVLEGTMIATLVAILLRAIGSRDSRTRFAVWFSTLVAIAVLSLFSLLAYKSPAIASSMPHLTLPSQWARYAVLAWAAVASAGLLRIVVALRQVCLLKRRAGALRNEGLETQLRHTLQESRSVRPVRLCVSDDLGVPTAIGYFRSAVLIPRWAVTGLSSAELNAVILHELGHLRRWDDWTNLAQKILRALLFFHPAVWFIDSRLTVEREMACDDLVLAKTYDARGYAECLVSVAEKSAFRSGVALALAAVSRMRQTALRLTRILDANRSSETRGSNSVLAVVGAMIVAAFATLPYTPALVVFADRSPLTDFAAVSSSSTAEPTLIPVSYRPNMHPRIVTAVAHSSANTPSVSRTQGVTNKSRSSARPASVVRASNHRATSATPMMLRASFTQAEQMPTPAMVFLIQIEEVQTQEVPTQQSNGGNVSLVRVLVWHVSVSSREAQIQNGSVSKSI